MTLTSDKVADRIADEVWPRTYPGEPRFAVVLRWFIWQVVPATLGAALIRHFWH